MKFFLVQILAVLVLISCSKLDRDNEPQDPVGVDLQTVKNFRQNYIDLEEKISSPSGFVHGGDGMLFSCLKFVSGGRVDWKSSHKTGDEFWMIRKPNYEPDELSERWSWYSKDMLTGELFCIWKSQDLSWLQKRIQWLEDHDWDICGGREYADPYITWKSRCKISANLKDTIFEMRKRLGGKGHTATWIPQIWNPLDHEDFTAHLTVLSIYLRGIMMNGINDNQLDYLKKTAESQDRNGLFVAFYKTFTDGNMEEPYRLLFEIFPRDRLPTSQDKCSEYLWQRDQNKDGDWKPCPSENKNYDGVDAMILATMIIGDFR